MTKSNTPLLCYYGDDFTGSTDALEALTRAGARTALFVAPPTPEVLRRYPGLHAVGVAGMTRAMTPVAIEETLGPQLTALRALGAPHVHYKVCSTLDSSPAVGSIGRVIDVATKVFDGPFVPLVVGAPALGRHCVFGNLFARAGNDGETFRLDRHPSMREHPITPADESDLRLHLGRQTTKRIGLFDILKVQLSTQEARLALAALLSQGFEVVLFDVLYDEQLERIGALVDSYASIQKPLFSVGSSGFDTALAAHWTAVGHLQPVDTFADAGAADPLLVASGSCSPVTAEQIAWAESHGFEEVALDTVALVSEDRARNVERHAATTAVRHLRAGRSVVVHTSRGPRDPRLAATAEALSRRGLAGMELKIQSARLFGGALGRIVRRTVDEAGVRRLAIAGGDTSGHIARFLGIEALEMIAPLAPGAPLCRAHARGSTTDGLEVSFKGGQVGATDYFRAVRAGRA